MSKVIHLFKSEEDEKDKLIIYIKELLAKAESGEIKNLMIAGEGIDNGDKVVLTGWVNMDCETRTRMLVHHNMDLVKSMIEANYITP